MHQTPPGPEQDQQPDRHTNSEAPSEIAAGASPLKPESFLRLQHTIGNQALRALSNAGRVRPRPQSELPALRGVASPRRSPSLALRDRLMARQHRPAGTGERPPSSPALGMRVALQTLPAVRPIQRSIKGTHQFTGGEMKIEFAKKDGKQPGDVAHEIGTITFTPDKNAAKSDSIRFIQITRLTQIDDQGKESDYQWSADGQSPRNDMETENSGEKNVAGGWYVDQDARSMKKRTAKSDPEVKPYYDATGPSRSGKNNIGKTGPPPVAATMEDWPGWNAASKFRFVATVKGEDNGVSYGTVLWGFGIGTDPDGVARVKDEYQEFRNYPGETLEAAVEKFNEYYQNPGTSNAPAE